MNPPRIARAFVRHRLSDCVAPTMYRCSLAMRTRRRGRPYETEHRPVQGSRRQKISTCIISFSTEQVEEAVASPRTLTARSIGAKPSRQAPRPHRGAEPGPSRLRRLVLAGGRAHLSLLQSRAVPVRSICRCRRHAVRSRVIRLSKARGRTASTSVLCGYRVLLCKKGPASFIASCFVPCITCGRALRVYAQTETYATSNKSTSYTKNQTVWPRDHLCCLHKWEITSRRFPNATRGRTKLQRPKDCPLGCQ